MQHLLFFKLIDLCYLLDGDLDAFLPSYTYLIDAPELEHLKNDQKFQFLLKFGYEHVHEVYQMKPKEGEF